MTPPFFTRSKNTPQTETGDFFAKQRKQQPFFPAAPSILPTAEQQDLSNEQETSQMKTDAFSGKQYQEKTGYAGDVVQQMSYRTSPIVQRSSAKVVQRIVDTKALKDGEMNINMPQDTRAEGAAAGLHGTIKFTPDIKAPYSNKIGMIQIVKLTDAGGANVNPGSLPAVGQGDPKTGVRTQEDKAKGAEGGFFTDVYHQTFDAKGSTGVTKKGSQLLPYYQYLPVFGFKRSEDIADIKAAVLSDFPSGGGNLDFTFETIAKGDDNMHVYGAVKWSFKVRTDAKGVPKVQDENHSFEESQSATFDAALEKHRDYYVHEPVTIYFDFAQDQPAAGETAKIDTFLNYLSRFPDVKMKLTGFADIRGPESFNRGLATRRVQKIHTEMVAKGIDAARLSLFQGGETDQFTQDVNKGREDQDLAANRRGNRRVMIEFEHPTPAAPKAKTP